MRASEYKAMGSVMPNFVLLNNRKKGATSVEVLSLLMPPEHKDFNQMR